MSNLSSSERPQRFSGTRWWCSAVFSTSFELRGVDLLFFSCVENKFGTFWGDVLLMKFDAFL
jgi:hypothetical protein